VGSRARLLREPRHRCRAADERQRLQLCQEPLATGAARRARGRHLKTRPYRSPTNGKVERFHQTMAREWDYGLVYGSHRQRNRALPHGLEHDNTHRPHSSPRRAATDQPRSQRPWIGQLVVAGFVLGLVIVFRLAGDSVRLRNH
jgi:hypothetical protein